MKKYKSKKAPIVRPSIACCWENCSVECIDDQALNNHIESHWLKYKKDNEESKEFSCPWMDCSYVSQNLPTMERHSYYHGYYAGLLAQGKLECEKNKNIPKCYAPQRQGHIVPEMLNDFCCEYGDCERTFSSITDFHDHIVQHVIFQYEISKSADNNRPAKIQCNWNYCKKILDNRYRLLEHVRTHTNKKDVACFHCGELFRTKTGLFDHLRRQPENNNNDFQCLQCFKFFSTEKLLRIHMKKHLNCHKCSLCDMTCSDLNTLAIHVRYRHLKDKPFECRECGHRCVRESDLTKHIQNVHQKKVHRCDQPGCYYAVRTYNLLRRHYLEIHGNTPFIYVCHCCEKAFKSGKSLSSHLIKEHGFQMRSGHKRFTYRVDENGFYRLETRRIESLEVTKQIDHESPFESTDVTQDSSCYEIVSMTNEKRIIVSNDPIEAHLVGEVVISLPNMERTSDYV